MTDYAILAGRYIMYTRDFNTFNSFSLSFFSTSRSVKLSSEATCSTARTQVLFRFFPFFFPPSLPAFYPAHPCGTANVSQGLPGTRTVTKWNGRKNEWKTIKEGPRGVE